LKHGGKLKTKPNNFYISSKYFLNNHSLYLGTLTGGKTLGKIGDRMNKKLLLISAFVIVGVAVLGGVSLWNWFLGSPQTASGTLQAVPLQATTASQASTAQTPTPSDPAAVLQSSATAQSASQPVATATSAVSGSNGQVATTASPNGLTVFQISQTDSKAQFTIYEELMGQPNNVIGVTNQVAGQIGVNLNDLSTAQVGEIKIDARGLTTDSSQRNRMIQNRILNTGNYEFVTFTPTQISGLSGSAVVGQSIQFQITGNLTIQDVTQPVTFDVTAQAVSNNQISGTATATIQRSDFNLQIPSVPRVANVGEQVALQIDFVANTTSNNGD
jgi:polyisoprenoid-binding protein YceI